MQSRGFAFSRATMHPYVGSISRFEIYVLIFVALGFFFVYAYVAFLWTSLGIYDQYNVIFDTDPNRWLVRLSHGWVFGDFNHPLGPYLFAPPIRALGAVAPYLGWQDTVAFRETIGLLIAPTFASLKCISFYLGFRMLQLNRAEASLATTLGMFGFSAVVFAAVPSGYPITGALYAICFLATVGSLKHGLNATPWGLLASGFVAIGVTITNVISLGWFIWARFALDGAWFRGLVRAIMIAGTIMAGVLAASYTGNALRTQEAPAPTPNTGGFGPYSLSAEEQLKRILGLPELLARSFVPTQPTPLKNELAVRNENLVQFELAYPPERASLTERTVLTVLSLGLLIGAAVTAAVTGGPWLYIAAASALSLLMSGMLYSAGGTNPYLYTQHLQPAATVLLAAWFTLPCLRRTSVYCVIATLVGAMAIADVWLMAEITSWMQLPVERQPHNAE